MIKNREQTKHNMDSDLEHGGNIYRLAEELKMHERKIIDFSASINPLGVSKKIKAELRKRLKYLHNYPDPDAKRLRKQLAQYHGIDPEMILCGNGSTELIYLITRTLKATKVLIPAPTFSEYERAVILNSQQSSVSPPTHPSPSRGEDEGGGESLNSKLSDLGTIKYLMLDEKEGFKMDPDKFIQALQNKDSLVTRHSSLITFFDMAFLCNPNNPTGLLLKRDSVMKIAETAKDLKCILVVDEAFIDFCPEETVINEIQNNPYLIVLRSMTKFYALTGLRLGYGVFPKHLTDRLKEYKEPWTVNNLAQRAAVVALKDRVYRNETFRLIEEEKRFLENGFKKLGIEFFHSDANFYLLKLNNAKEIYQMLKKKGILVRDCSNFRGLDSTYIRVAVKSHKENTILIRELAEIKEVMKQ